MHNVHCVCIQNGSSIFKKFSGPKIELLWFSSGCYPVDNDTFVSHILDVNSLIYTLIALMTIYQFNSSVQTQTIQWQILICSTEFRPFLTLPNEPNSPWLVARLLIERHRLQIKIRLTFIKFWARKRINVQMKIRRFCDVSYCLKINFIPLNLFIPWTFDAVCQFYKRISYRSTSISCSLSILFFVVSWWLKG